MYSTKFTVLRADLFAGQGYRFLENLRTLSDLFPYAPEDTFLNQFPTKLP